MGSRPRALHTRMVHPNSAEVRPAGVSPVLDRSTTFRLDAEAERALAERQGHDRFDIYGRFGTSTTRDASALVAELEGAEAAMLFASGMGAIASVLFAFAEPGRPIAVASDVYGGTEGLLRAEMPARGVKLIRFDAADPSSLAEAIDDGLRPSVVWCESMSNPLLKVAAMGELAALAKRAGAKLCVDATFAGGIAQRPLERGADLVVHSATKFLNGHSDVIAGAVAGSTADIDAVFGRMTHLGACIDPSGAWLLARGMRTLPLRFAQQSKSAATLADRLAAHPRVRCVYYPTRSDHPTYAVAEQELTSGGGVLSFELEDGAAAMRFGEKLELCAFAVSLGGVETLVAIPRRSSHVGLTPEHWDGLGIREGLVRVAVGLEDVEDLWADMAAALEA